MTLEEQPLSVSKQEVLENKQTFPVKDVEQTSSSSKSSSRKPTGNIKIPEFNVKVVNLERALSKPTVNVTQEGYCNLKENANSRNMTVDAEVFDRKYQNFLCL